MEGLTFGAFMDPVREELKVFYSSRMLLSGALGCGGIIQPLRASQEETPVLFKLKQITVTQEPIGVKVERLEESLASIETWTGSNLFLECSKSNLSIKSLK